MYFFIYFHEASGVICQEMSLWLVFFLWDNEAALRNELQLLCVSVSSGLTAALGSDSELTFPLDLPKKLTSLFYFRVTK